MKICLVYYSAGGIYEGWTENVKAFMDETAAGCFALDCQRVVDAHNEAKSLFFKKNEGKKMFDIDYTEYPKDPEIEIDGEWKSISDDADFLVEELELVP